MGATLKKIADLAGVSIGTVDRALHQRGRVNPQVAERILQIAKELDYHPNTVAKSLSIRNRKLKITVIFHIEKPNTFFEDVYSGIIKCKEEIRDFGIFVEILFCSDFNAKCQLSLINQSIENGTNAIAIVPINDAIIKEKLNELYRNNFPVVFLTNIIDDTDYLGFVGCDYTLSGKITAGLINLISMPNNNNLLLFSPSFHMHGHVLRVNGLKQQLATAYPHISLNKVIELTGNDISDYQITQQVLSQFPETNLFICPGAYSLGNLQAIEDSGYNKKSKIICYDYSKKLENNILNGSITATIVQQPQLQGYTAVKVLFEYLTANKLPENKDNYIKTQIILRENLTEV